MPCTRAAASRTAPRAPHDFCCCLEQPSWTPPGFLADGRAPFHPVKPTESYAIQKDEAAVAVAEFTAEGGRLDRWLAHFATLVDNKPRYLFGDTITYADCALFHVLDAAMSQFPDAWDEPSREKLRATLEPYMKLITMHVTLGAYLKADDRAPWAGDSMM